jgi:hypothetical protein
MEIKKRKPFGKFGRHGSGGPVTVVVADGVLLYIYDSTVVSTGHN